ncbi:alpha/beta fold hydrolase [Janthinobacterium sp. Mn2066]|uniref:alpha/beta fold hydrolase n=1 Tax=Janthinobacterium sp. Mn2066 TaxID=3395264 RepID=UPI003BC0B4CD
MKRIIFSLLLATLIPLHESTAQNIKQATPENIPVEINKSLTPDIGGIKQFIEIKTDDFSKPVLLFLSGGPGSSMVNNANTFTNILKSRFTIVQWDQRDAGKTLKLNPSPTQPSVEQMQNDTHEVIEFIRNELHQEKIYLLGSSFGNVLGFHIVKNYPELLHAYFAVNPVINQLQSEKELLEVLKKYFKEDPLASQELASVDSSIKTDQDMFYLRKWLFQKEGKAYATSNEFKDMFFQWSKTWSPVWKQVMYIDLPATLKKAGCPVYFFVGKNDIQTSARITTAYFNALQAPKKELFVFENSGHQIHQEEPEKFQNTIIGTLDTLNAGK